MPPPPPTHLTRRFFSIAARVRSLGHAAGAHHVQGYPVSHQGAKADWAKQFRHVGRAGLFYFPAFGVFLGWPLIAEKLVDGHLV